jgi:hypothetical protein
LILGASVTIWRSSIGSARLSATKTNLDNIKNSVIYFAIANGRLPCPDITIPPNNTGVSNPDPATCGTNCSCNTCANPPCFLPYQTLQLQLPGGKDSFGNVFFYDVSYDTVGGAQGGLTNTTLDTFCGVLFEYLNHATDTGVLRVPCVTNQNDAADNGQIGAAGQGYGVAASVISQTSVDNVFNAPPGLSGKNVASSPREYEMATRQNGTAYGDLVGELTYGDLYNKVCTTQKTKIRIQNYTTLTKCVSISSGPSIPINNGSYVEIYQGSRLIFYDYQLLPTPQCTTNQCGTPITFNMSPNNPPISVDAGTTDWSVPGGIARDGRVQITGACAVSDNTLPTP